MLCRVHGVPNAEKHPPQPPFKGGKSGAKGDVIPSKKRNAVRSAVSKQRSVCRVGANHLFALFCVVSGLSERKFRKSTLYAP